MRTSLADPKVNRSRRNLLKGAAGVAATAGISLAGLGAKPSLPRCWAPGTRLSVARRSQSL
ncbi:MAG: twin-arginine translocation signal domain-containing protein [Steroidobacteraceae bacterium]